MKKILSLISCVLLLCGFAYAEEGYSGYIVKLKEDCVLPIVSLYSGGKIETLDGEQTAQLLSEEYDEISLVYSPKRLVKANDEQTLNELVEMGVVEYAEPDLICELYGYTPETNPYYTYQWAHEAINSEYAWNVGAFGQEVKVAVIDSGVSPHPDLVHSLLPGGNFEGLSQRGETPGTDTMDNVWHGTFVAGTIAAQCNEFGVVGLAHNVKIVPLKVYDGSGNFYISSAIPAVYAAVDNYDCDVINMSFGASTADNGGGLLYMNGEYLSGKKPSNSSLSEAITYATVKGVIVVAASGNDGNSQKKWTDDDGNEMEIRHYSIPASITNVISVGNVQQSGNGSYSIAASSTHNENVLVSAPGTSVYSTYYKNSSSSYREADGTSFSAPYVSAAAAIMKCIDPTINFTKFYNLIKKTADKSYITEEQDEMYWGRGLIDVGAMIKEYLGKKEGFLSAVDVQTNEYNSSVYVHNPSESAKDYTVVIKSDLLEKIIPVSLEAGKTEEISLTSLGFEGEIDMKLYVGEYTEGSTAYSQRTSVIPLKGDANSDGKLDYSDIEMLGNYIFGLNTLDKLQIAGSNLYTDDEHTQSDVKINIKDLIKLAQKIAG